MRRHRSKPETPGSMTSSRTQSTGWASSVCSAARAPPAVATPKPATLRKSRSRATMSGSSSTTSTVCRITVSVAHREGRRRGFRKVFGACAAAARPGLVRSGQGSNDRKEDSMRRIPTMMASAGAAALTALVVSVAVPAIGDEGGGGTTGAGTADALGACLSARGVTGVPTGDALKPWIRQRVDAGDATVTAALEACAPKTVAPADRAADERQLRACLADHGAAVPDVQGGDLKRWIVEHQQDPATAGALKACHLVIGDHPGPAGCDKDGPGGPGPGQPGDKPGDGADATAAKRARAARS